MPDILERKLNRLEAEPRVAVDPSRAIDLTTSPAHPRVSFPAPDYTPPFQVLKRPDLEQALGLESGNVPRFVSEPQNVSSDPDGVCIVTANVLGQWNSHAGSHADQPGHWLAEPPLETFDNRQYRGLAVVLDLTDAFEGRSDRRMTVEMLERAARETELDLNCVRRLIVRTYRRTPLFWDPDFAYLDVSTGIFLGELPALVLFGTDAPSVDHPTASPILRCAHGGLWAGRVAVLEGLESDPLPRAPRIDGVLQTIWNPMLDFADAKGASVLFHPLQPPSGGNGTT